MERSENKLFYITSAIVAVSCTVSYYIIKRKMGVREAMDVFNNLNIKTVTTEEYCDQVVGELRRSCQNHRALGFDCEWVTEKGQKQPVALVQLSSHDGLCGLFRLNCMKKIPDSLKSLLEDPTIYKVGVAVTDDSRYLQLDYAAPLQSALDLRHLAKLSGFQPGGLAPLSKETLGLILDKSWRVRCSDWQAEQLTPQQELYAAVDAHVAIKIFDLLMTKLHRQDSLFPWLSRWSSAWLSTTVNKYCPTYAGINFKHKRQDSYKEKSEKSNKKDTNVNQEAVALAKRYPSGMRTKPLYHNCCLQAPDGEVLCTCDHKKALWYVQKELADIVEEEPLTVRLRFEPAGRSVGEVGRYYTLYKDNKCVVCAATESYIRKNVVPKEYRKYFPEIMKDHSSHDVVLLCASCHRQSNIRDQALRERLAADCAAPLPTHEHTKYKEDAASKKIKSAARALLHQSQKHVLPEARRKELEDVLLQYYPDHEEVTLQLLEEAAELQVLVENDGYESHGLKVVEYYLQRDGLLRLEEVWRHHFLETMRPCYMPALWSVKHNEERLRVKWEEGRLTEEHLKSMGLTNWLSS